MVVFWRIASFFILLACAVLFATLWAKVLAAVMTSAGFLLFALVPLPVVGGTFLLAYWIDRRLARLAKRKARERNIYGGELDRIELERVKGIEPSS